MYSEGNMPMKTPSTKSSELAKENEDMHTIAHRDYHRPNPGYFDMLNEQCGTYGAFPVKRGYCRTNQKY
jgi:hypothetical protein